MQASPGGSVMVFQDPLLRGLANAESMMIHFDWVMNVQAGPGGSVMVFQDPSLRGLAVGGQAARQPAAMGGMAPAAMADFAMDLLLGGGGPARASSMRTSSWSDDGQQAAGGNAGATLAGECHLPFPLPLPPTQGLK